eukprot:1138827-Lingulodinium_polyedra.AAC.1
MEARPHQHFVTMGKTGISCWGRGRNRTWSATRCSRPESPSCFVGDGDVEANGQTERTTSSNG